MQTYSTWLVIIKYKSTNIIGYCDTLTRIAKIKILTIPSIGENVEQLELSNIADGNEK